MQFQIFFLLALVATAMAYSLGAASCDSVKSQSDCLSNATCSWCVSGAVGASCMDKADADGLPSSVFTCTNKATKVEDANMAPRNQTLGDANLGASSCQVANYLRAAGFPSNTIGTMTCIAKWESSFNCGATNHNTNNSEDYGLFQINSYYWCSGDPMSKYNECGTSCTSLFDCQANANCAYRVWKEQGFTAWYGYQAHKSECDSAPAPC